MDSCYLCKKELRFWNKAKLDGLLFCERCANERWPQERRQKMLSTIYEGSPPVEFACIEKVQTEDPNIKKLQLMGHLFLTNKGICFAQLAQYEPVGLIRTVITAPAATAWSKTKPHGNLNEILMNSPRLIFYPIGTFKDIQVKKGMLGITIDVITHKYSWNHFYIYDKSSYSDYENIKNEVASYLKNIDNLKASGAISTTGKKANCGLGTREIDPLDLELEFQKQIQEEISDHPKRERRSEGESNKEQRYPICIKCGHSDFEYDEFWKEYTCKNCGWITKYT